MHRRYDPSKTLAQPNSERNVPPLSSQVDRAPGAKVVCFFFSKKKILPFFFV
jgi:hypothetical protein